MPGELCTGELWPAGASTRHTVFQTSCVLLLRCPDLPTEMELDAAAAAAGAGQPQDAAPAGRPSTPSRDEPNQALTSSVAALACSVQDMQATILAALDRQPDGSPRKIDLRSPPPRASVPKDVVREAAPSPGSRKQELHQPEVDLLRSNLNWQGSGQHALQQQLAAALDQLAAIHGPNNTAVGKGNSLANALVCEAAIRDLCFRAADLLAVASAPSNLPASSRRNEHLYRGKRVMSDILGTSSYLPTLDDPVASALAKHGMQVQTNSGAVPASTALCDVLSRALSSNTPPRMEDLDSLEAVVRNGCILTSPAKPIALIIDAIQKLNKGITSAAADEDFPHCITLLAEQAMLMKQVEGEFLPLARDLGVKAATQLWSSRSAEPVWAAALFQRDNPRHMAFLNSMVSDPGLSEAVGHMLRVLMQGPLLAEADRRKSHRQQIAALQQRLAEMQGRAGGEGGDDDLRPFQLVTHSRGGRGRATAQSYGGRHSYAGALAAPLPPLYPRPPSRAGSGSLYGSDAGGDDAEVTSPQRASSDQQIASAAASAAVQAVQAYQQQQQHPLQPIGPPPGAQAYHNQGGPQQSLFLGGGGRGYHGGPGYPPGPGAFHSQPHPPPGGRGGGRGGRGSAYQPFGPNPPGRGYERGGRS